MKTHMTETENMDGKRIWVVYAKIAYVPTTCHPKPKREAAFTFYNKAHAKAFKAACDECSPVLTVQ